VRGNLVAGMTVDTPLGDLDHFQSEKEACRAPEPESASSGFIILLDTGSGHPWG
jgi:hypothetical protein